MKKQTYWRVLLAASFLLMLAGSAAQAADITVDGTNCTLPDAITAANSDTATGGCTAGSGDDTITLQADVTLAATLPDIVSTMTIEGGGHFISGNNDENVNSVLLVTDDGNLTLNDTTIKEGNATGETTGEGGGIYNSGTVTLTNSTVSGNTASSGGGGICNDGTVTLTNSTVSGNTAASDGGGIENFGTLTLINSTISDNTASDGIGGGLDNFGVTVTLTSSIISGNSASSGNEVYSDSSSTVTAANFNVFGHSGETSAQAFVDFMPGANDVNAASDGGTPTALDAILNTTLADNGGPTQTHALVAGSPAIDLDASCSTGLTTDQRGYTRPAVSGTGCDAGAYEYGAVPVFTVTPNASIGGSVAPDTAQAVNEGDTVSFTVTPDAGYTTDEVVSGTCPEGSWAGSTYTTGQIDADCTVEFSFIADKKKINMVPIYKLLLLK